MNRGRPRAALFPFDIRERGLAHPDFPCELGLMPTILLAKAADGCAVLAEPSCPSAYLHSRGDGDRLCRTHAANLRSCLVRRKLVADTHGH